MGRVRLISLLLFLAQARAAKPDCPASTIRAGGTTQVSASASNALNMQQGSCSYDETNPVAWASASYDLVSGYVYTDAHVGGLTCSAGGDVFTHDRFVLTGPASASPIVFHGQLAITAPVYDEFWGGTFAVIREGTSNADSSLAEPSHRTARIAIAVLPGGAFDLSMHVNSSVSGIYGGPGTLSVITVLSFPDLPSEYGLESCHGFLAGVALPVRPTNWGQLKARYR